MALTQIGYSTGSGSYGSPSARRLSSLGQTSAGAAGGQQLYSLSGALGSRATVPRVTNPDTGMVVPPLTPPAVAPSAQPPATVTPPLNPIIDHQPGAAAGGDTGTQTQGPSSGASVSGGSATPNLDTDPILAQIKQLATKSDTDARAAAVSGKEQLVETLGDPELAAALGLGSNVAGVAGQNPNSTLAQILAGHQNALGAIDQGDNRANLFYSSTHAHNLANEGQAYQTNQYNARQDVRGKIGGIDQTLAQALADSQQRIAQAAADASNRILASGGGTLTAADAGAPSSGASSGSGSGGSGGSSSAPTDGTGTGTGTGGAGGGGGGGTSTPATSGANFNASLGAILANAGVGGNPGSAGFVVPAPAPAPPPWVGPAVAPATAPDYLSALMAANAGRGRTRPIAL